MSDLKTDFECCEGKSCEDDEEQCSICLSNLSKDETVISKLPCGHCFHTECINKWRQNTCPCCRSIINKEIPNLDYTR